MSTNLEVGLLGHNNVGIETFKTLFHHPPPPILTTHAIYCMPHQISLIPTLANIHIILLERHIISTALERHISLLDGLI